MKTRSNRVLAWLIGIVACVVSGCASNSIHRYHGPYSGAAATGVPATAGDGTPVMSAERLTEFADGCRWHGDPFSPGPNPYRTDKRCMSHSVEVTDRYQLFFVEFDEQGRLYDDLQYRQLFDYLDDRKNCGSDLSIVVFVHGWRHNSDTKDSNVKLARDVLSFTYDSEQTEPHPNQARNKSLDLRQRGPCRSTRVGNGKGREVLGIYVGWRGKSLDGGNGIFSFWELPTVWDRKNTAENVAVGSVRELFSRLRVFQRIVNRYEFDCGSGDPGAFQCKRVRMLIVGHSFGGLLVFNAVSPSIMDGLSQGVDFDPRVPENCQEWRAAAGGQGGNNDSALVRSFADLIVLVNPAIEGARFEPLHQAVQRRLREEGFCPNQKPVLVVVTAHDDSATKVFFPLSKLVTTLFESTSPRGVEHPRSLAISNMRHAEESQASRHAMGHIARYQTHDMRGPAVLMQAGAQHDPSAAALRDYCSAGTGDALDQALRACRCGAAGWGAYLHAWHEARNCPSYVEEVNAAESLAADTAEGSLFKPGRRMFCGGAVIDLRPATMAVDGNGQPLEGVSEALTVNASNSPVWMIKSFDPSIVHQHSGIEQDPFKLFVRQVYHEISLRDYDPGGAKKMRKEAADNFWRECRGAAPVAAP